MSKASSVQLLGIVLVLTLVLHFIPGPFAALATYPEDWVIPITAPMNEAMMWFADLFGPLFKAIGWLLEWPIILAQAVLSLLPWSVTCFLFMAVAYLASGWRLSLFTLTALLYMAAIGYWSQSMNSLAIVLISVPGAIAVGFGFGVLGFRSARARRMIMPLLDLLQTIPAFAYLLPILILFGFGTTVGLVSSILYAFPPMVRNTILGLDSVPATLIEAGQISGANARQLFWKVRMPAARNQLLLGVNQTTMASLSMVIIASIIGGTNDIGWVVLSTMRKAQFGESLLAGFVIALMAMVLDRISYGFATKDRSHSAATSDANPLIVIVSGGVVVWGLSFVLPVLAHWPDSLVFDPAPAMNAALESFIVNWRTVLEAIKNSAFFYLMLPVKIGFSQAISPFSWGFTLTPALVAAYVGAVLGLSAWAWHRSGAGSAMAALIFGTFAFVGLTNVPWLALLVLFVVISYQTSGTNLAIGTALGLGFLVVVGIWPQSVLSLYLCGIAVLISFSLGTGIGIWSAHNNTVSSIVRPIMDTLQTMPLFVILIPFVMIFKIGEFTALLAIIAYAIVPAIRYTEHGLRNLPANIIESATALGCTPVQLLLKVKLPLALPAIMLGLNQTIIYGIGMLVITALVGTNGLGQRIYIGLSDGDFGVGMVAGIGMAIIAMIADRITQSISLRKQVQLGLKTAMH